MLTSLTITSGRGDVDKVLEGRPWLFDKHVLVLKKLELQFNLGTSFLTLHFSGFDSTIFNHNMKGRCSHKAS